MFSIILMSLFASQSFAQFVYPDAPYQYWAAGGSPDASAIFNSVHASMRQFDSSVNYESNCAFLATIPANTQLYHGTSKEATITGLKWLAFEPEHAMLFSHPSEHWSTQHQSEQKKESDDSSIWQNFQENKDWGYLHTYSTSRSLRLLYLDGTSAAKTNLGTLDLQDKVILQDQFGFSTTLDDDNIRAAELCRVARTDWSDRIDGFIRMETGFEVILCSVDNAELNHTGTVATQKFKDSFAIYKALAQRFHGIGGGRVAIDYGAFLTTHGRILDDESLGALRSELDALILGSSDIEEGQGHFNWQAVTDMIIERYAVPLRLLASDVLESKSVFNQEVNRLLLPFIDHRGRNFEKEVARCAKYVMPQSYTDCPAASAIFRVSETICTELIHSVEKDSELEKGVTRMRQLMTELGWSTWKDCAPGCKDNEVCYVPVWPFSLALDARRAPVCINEDGFYELAAEEILSASRGRSSA